MTKNNKDPQIWIRFIATLSSTLPRPRPRPVLHSVSSPLISHSQCSIVVICSIPRKYFKFSRQNSCLNHTVIQPPATVTALVTSSLPYLTAPADQPLPCYTFENILYRYMLQMTQLALYGHSQSRQL